MNIFHYVLVIEKYLLRECTTGILPYIMPNVEKVVFILKIPKCLRIYVRLNIQVFEFFFSDVKPEVEFK